MVTDIIWFVLMIVLLLICIFGHKFFNSKLFRKEKIFGNAFERWIYCMAFFAILSVIIIFVVEIINNL